METEKETKRKPRGQIRCWYRADRPNQPWYLGWIIDGKKFAESFATEKERYERKKALERSKRNNTLALEPTRREIEEYRAFKRVIGDADWRDVVEAWQKSGAPLSMNVEDMASAYKKWQHERLAAGKLSERVMDRQIKVAEDFGRDHHGRKASSLTKEGVVDWIESYHEDCVSGSPAPTTFNRTLTILGTMWDVSEEPNNLCKGKKGIESRAEADGTESIRVLPVDQVELLLAYGMTFTPWQMPRIALEVFLGTRFRTAANITKGHVNAVDRGITYTPDIFKTKKRQYLDGLESNIWDWIAMATDETWELTERQYAESKSRLFVDAGVPHPHNCLRHSAASYFAAAFKDPGRTAILLCHTSQKKLWDTYKGIATQADGLRYYKITPEYLRKRIESGAVKLPDPQKSAPQ